MRNLSLLVVTLIWASAGPAYAQAQNAAPPGEGRRPNIILVVVDDLRWDELGVAGHPYVETPNIDRLAEEGITFSSAFHAVPLCSPNRASILTGQYPSRHGIIDNVARSLASHQLKTFPQALQPAGYTTGFVGKWHMGNDPTPRPGFNYWEALPGQGRSTDPEIYENGAVHTVEGYTTDVLTDRAVEFIELERDNPFFLYLGHKAVHPDIAQLDDGSVDLSKPARYVPAPRHEGRYDNEAFPRRPNVVDSPDELVGKPAVRRALQLKYSVAFTEAFASRMFDFSGGEDIIRRRAEMLLAVDDSVGRILETLDRLDILKSTAVIFTSDNGYWYGEHSLDNERRLPYEEGIRMPLLMHYPALVEGGTESDDLISSVDIASTVLDLADAEIGEHLQGRSVVPLLNGTVADWRDAILVEFYTYENPMPWLVDMDYRAIRGERYKYIHWMQHPDENELYDLTEDPYEMNNLYENDAYAGVVADMREKLDDGVLKAMGLRNSRD